MEEDSSGRVAKTPNSWTTSERCRLGIGLECPRVVRDQDLAPSSAFLLLRSAGAG